MGNYKKVLPEEFVKMLRNLLTKEVSKPQKEGLKSVIKFFEEFYNDTLLPAESTKVIEQRVKESVQHVIEVVKLQSTEEVSFFLSNEETVGNLNCRDLVNVIFVLDIALRRMMFISITGTGACASYIPYRVK